MTVAALAGGAAWWAIGAAAVADAAIIAGTAYSSYSSYQQGKAAEQAAKAQAEQYKAQAAILEQQARENERQAEYENMRAGIAQVQGEQEAANRSRQLAAEIGALYAGYAGNGLLVDGPSGDTFGSVLKSTVTEGQADISTIKDNAAINVWEHLANKGSYETSALVNRMGANMNVTASGNSVIAGRNSRSIGKLNAIGTALQGTGTLIGSGFASYGTLSQTGQGGALYDWTRLPA